MTIRPVIKQDVYAEKSFIQFLTNYFKNLKSGGKFICCPEVIFDKDRFDHFDA